MRDAAAPSSGRRRRAVGGVGDVDDGGGAPPPTTTTMRMSPLQTTIYPAMSRYADVLITSETRKVSER
jgi:hypothetical protein